MPILEDIRAKHPEYGAMSDQQLADAIYKQYYSDMPRDQFDAKIGFNKKDALQSTYQSALDKVRQTQYPGMSDEQWQQVVKVAFPAYSLKDQGQAGQLFGLTDEISAGMSGINSQVRNWLGQGTPGFGRAFNDSLALEQARRDVGRENNGALGTGMEILGAVSGVGTKGAPVPSPAPGLIPTALKSGAAGAAMGGVQGFGQTDGSLLDRAKGAGWGGAFGLGVGVAAPIVARGASVVAGNWRSAAAARDAARQMGISPEAARMLTEVGRADDTLGATGRANMAAAGREGMVADAGQSARNVLDWAIQSSGQAGARARAAIDARVTRDAGALQDALDAALGKPQGVQTTRDAIRTSTASARKTAYDAAYDQPINYASPNGLILDELLSRVNPSTIEAANELMRAEGLASKQIMAQIGDNGSIVFMKKPDVRQIDYITRALNDVEKDARGALGGVTNKARVWGNLSGDIRDTLRNTVDEYGVALDTAADPIRRSQAVEFGSTMLKDNVTREEVANTVIRMSKPEREAAAQGVRSAFDDILANVKRAVTDGDVQAREGIVILRQLSSRAAREKITTLIGTDKANTLFAELDRAAKSFELRADVAQNSKTFMRQNMNEKMTEIGKPDGIIPSLMQGEVLQAAKSGVRTASGYSPQRVAQLKDQTAGEMVDVLTRQGGQGLAAMDTLDKLLQRIDRNSLAAQWLIDLGQKFVGPGAIVASNLQSQATRR